MAVFHHEYLVPATLERVAGFHSTTSALQYLTPPPVRVTLQQVEPLAEGSLSRFTLWFGPLPLRWAARHSQVDRLHGFTDTQESGPMASWRHTHRFESVDDCTTLVIEHIEYSHKSGGLGLLTRLLFSPPALRFLFAYRARALTRALH